VADLLAAGGAAAAGAAATGTGTAAETAILASRKTRSATRCSTRLPAPQPQPRYGWRYRGTAASSGANAEASIPRLCSNCRGLPAQLHRHDRGCHNRRTTAIAASRLATPFSPTIQDWRDGRTPCRRSWPHRPCHRTPGHRHRSYRHNAQPPVLHDRSRWVLAGSLQVGEQVRTETRIGDNPRLHHYRHSHYMWDLTVDGATASSSGRRGAGAQAGHVVRFGSSARILCTPRLRRPSRRRLQRSRRHLE